MDKITEVEFKQALDQIITAGLNSLDVATVFGQLSITKRFVEVVYDTNVVASLDRMRQQQAIAQEAARQLAAQQAANAPAEGVSTNDIHPA
jgi:ribosomal silencing factor RsfS